MSSNGVCAIIVTFHPTPRDLLNLPLLRPQVEEVVVVDNGSALESLRLLRALCCSLGVTLIENGVNRGIAAALNTGVRRAIADRHRWVVLLDQDSTVTEGFVEWMLHDIRRSPQTQVMQIVPRYCDPQTGKEEMVLRARDGGAFVTRTSGSLFPVDVFERCGLFREELFIYCVDDDFSLRLRLMGFFIAQSTNAILMHASGAPTPVSVLGMSLLTRNYRPEVQYYWARNRVWLTLHYGLRFPRLFIIAVRSLVGIPLKIALAEHGRPIKLYMFGRGLIDGFTGRTGPRVIVS